jgi:hypothetical protein
MEQLHHRTYVTFGEERLGDVMGVCVPCHRFIEGIWPFPELKVAKDSLAFRGDRGNGESALWNEYLAVCKAREGKIAVHRWVDGRGWVTFWVEPLKELSGNA